MKLKRFLSDFAPTWHISKKFMKIWDVFCLLRILPGKTFEVLNKFSEESTFKKKGILFFRPLLE